MIIRIINQRFKVKPLEVCCVGAHSDCICCLAKLVVVAAMVVVLLVVLLVVVVVVVVFPLAPTNAVNWKP